MPKMAEPRTFHVQICIENKIYYGSNICVAVYLVIFRRQPNMFSERILSSRLPMPSFGSVFCLLGVTISQQSAYCFAMIALPSFLSLLVCVSSFLLCILIANLSKRNYSMQFYNSALLNHVILVKSSLKNKETLFRGQFLLIPRNFFFKDDTECLCTLVQ